MTNLNDSITLDQLKIGQKATVISLTDRSTNRSRLLDMGILPGTKIEVEMRSPLGDPTAYRVRGAVIALRRAQASHIKIELETSEQ